MINIIPVFVKYHWSDDIGNKFKDWNEKRS